MINIADLSMMLSSSFSVYVRVPLVIPDVDVTQCTFIVGTDELVQRLEVIIHIL